jgi:hypothetical protein
MAGKGDKPRIGNRKAFNKNFDLIKKPTKNLDWDKVKGAKKTKVYK